MRRKEFSFSKAPSAANNPRKLGLSRSARRATPVEPGTILLISEDATLHQTLRSLANEHGRMVIRVNGTAGILEVVYVLQPAVILLDLDLSGDAAWQAGAAILDQKPCPPLILLTGRTEPFDVRTAIRAGSIADKAAGPMYVLELINLVQALPSPERIERNAVQRVLIRWLGPRNWSPPGSSVRRFWARDT